MSLVLSTLHKRSQKLKQSQGSQLGVWVRGYEGHQLAGICFHRLPRMTDRSFANRVVLSVNAAIYRNFEEKPAMRWSFEMGIGGESDKMLFDFIFRVRKVFIVHGSTGCIRMVSDFSSLVKYPENLREFAITFGLHQKTQISVSLTFDRAISRIQEVYDCDCRCLNQVKAFLGTTAQTQGPQDTVSTVVLEDEKRILQALKEIKDLLSQHVPQLLQELEVKSLLTLI